MEAYYKAQKIIKEEDWDAFLKAARATLPTTFRISPVVAFADDMKKKLRSHFSDLKIDELAQEMAEDDERLKAPEPIPWYPDELAWGMSISKKALKKTPALERFHKYLVAETDTGNITRQEAVSMIPPLFMDVEPHHRVLDMCAAPGSKTSQCLEFLHAKCGANGVPSGVVIANDADRERCSMLTHQMKRINSPSLMILHHEAQNIPMLWERSGTGPGTTRTPMRYDRVLCDVPCSGDGTMRKNVDVWKKWSPAQGLGLHKTQIMILTRGIELCEVGGVVVYSTCSMNPIENEAVIAAVVSKFRHCVEVADTTHIAPALIRHPGLLTWQVRDRKDENVWYTPETLPPNLKQVYPSTCFPPAPEEAAALNLSRCCRIYPHDQDTGGFFIVKLVKTADHIPAKTLAPTVAGTEVLATATAAAPGAEGDDNASKLEQGKPDSAAGAAGAEGAAGPADATVVASQEAAVGEKRKASIDGGGEGVGGSGGAEGEKATETKEAKKQKKSKYDILIPMAQDGLAGRLRDFYGLGPGFAMDQLFTSSDTGNKIYFVSGAVRQLLAADGKGQLHTVHAGVKLFEKNPTKNDIFDFRLRQEGVSFVLPHMTKRVLRLDMVDFQVLLTQRCMLFANLKTAGAAQACEDMGGGCVLFVLNSEQYTEANSIYLAGWRGSQQLTLFVSKVEVMALSHKVLGTAKTSTEAAESKGVAGEEGSEEKTDTQTGCESSVKAEGQSEGGHVKKDVSEEGAAAGGAEA